ncbi:Myosin 10A, isoform D [Entophlyctis luteolus]|nr:Myosin 10A, isoform D [Entophlyctis luteolus]
MILPDCARTHPCPDSPPSQTVPRYAVVLTGFDFVNPDFALLSMAETEIVLIKKVDTESGEIFLAKLVVQHSIEAQWAFGEKNGLCGWFPLSCVRWIDPNEADLIDISDTICANRLARNRNKQADASVMPLFATSRTSLQTGSDDDSTQSAIDKDGPLLQSGQRPEVNTTPAILVSSENFIISTPKKQRKSWFIGRSSKQSVSKADEHVHLSASLDISDVLSITQCGPPASLPSAKIRSPSISAASTPRPVPSIVVGATAPAKMLWVGWIGGPEALGRLPPMSQSERRRQEVIFEIVATEREYIADLELVKQIMNQLRNEHTLGRKDMAVIFSNLEAILPVNKELLKRLEDRQSHHVNGIVEQIGDIFIEVADFLKMYTMYCSNHQHALIKLQAVRQNKTVSKFFESLSATPEFRFFDLSNYLLKPVQRICKYPLLLRELIKATDSAHSDFLPLTIALSKIETVVAIVNEGARQASNVQKTIDLQNRLNAKLRIVAPFRILKKYGCIDLVKTRGGLRRCELYIFSDMLILAKLPSASSSSDTLSSHNASLGSERLKLVAMIPFDMLFVNSIANSSSQSQDRKRSPSISRVNHLIELVHVNKGKYLLSADTESAKSDWIKALQETTDEWVCAGSIKAAAVQNAVCPTQPPSVDGATTEEASFAHLEGAGAESAGITQALPIESGRLPEERDESESESLSDFDANTIIQQPMRKDPASSRKKPISMFSRSAQHLEMAARSQGTLQSTSSFQADFNGSVLVVEPAARNELAPQNFIVQNTQLAGSHDSGATGASMPQLQSLDSSSQSIQESGVNHKITDSIVSLPLPIVRAQERLPADSTSSIFPAEKQHLESNIVPSDMRDSGSDSDYSEVSREDAPEGEIESRTCVVTANLWQHEQRETPLTKLLMNASLQSLPSLSKQNKPTRFVAEKLRCPRAHNFASVSKDPASDQSLESNEKVHEIIKQKLLSKDTTIDDKSAKVSANETVDEDDKRDGVEDGLASMLTVRQRQEMLLRNATSANTGLGSHRANIFRLEATGEAGSNSSREISKQSSVAQLKETSRDTVVADEPQSSVPPLQIPQSGVNKPVSRVIINNVFRPAGQRQTDFIYVVHIFYNEDNSKFAVVHHTFEDFFDLHVALIAEFPSDSGIGENSHRIIPHFPSQMMFVNSAVAMQRLGLLQSYGSVEDGPLAVGEQQKAA